MEKKYININYACLECRKVFKKYKYIEDKHGNWEHVEYDVLCPQYSLVVRPLSSE